MTVASGKRQAASGERQAASGERRAKTQILVSLLYALCSLLLACPGWAAGPNQGIDGPSQAPPYTILEHRLSGDWESGVWDIEPALQPFSQWRVSSDGLGVLWTAPPGRYTLRVISVHWAEKRVAQWRLVVTIGDKPPGPEPKPPEPEPRPDQKYQVVILIESGNLDDLPSGQLEIVASRKFRAALQAAGHQLVAIVDRDTPPSDRLRPFFAAASGKSPPLLLRAPLAGGQIEAIPLPANIDDTLQALQKSPGTWAPQVPHSGTAPANPSCPGGTCPLPRRW